MSEGVTANLDRLLGRAARYGGSATKCVIEGWYIHNGKVRLILRSEASGYLDTYFLRDICVDRAPAPTPPLAGHFKEGR